jgi:hypothetical protein
LYETGDPYRLVEPGGTLDTSEARFEAASDRAVRVTGSRFLPSDEYTVRLEGAALVGYRSIVVAGIRDPLVLRQLDTFLSNLRAVVARKVEDDLKLSADQYTLNFRIYGRDGSMGDTEPVMRIEGHEAGLIIDVVASSQAVAADIIPIVSHTGLHTPIPEYDGLISNFAYPFSPGGIDAGPVYQFCANHVWRLDDPCKPFKMALFDL